MNELATVSKLKLLFVPEHHIETFTEDILEVYEDITTRQNKLPSIEDFEMRSDIDDCLYFLTSEQLYGNGSDFRGLTQRADIDDFFLVADEFYVNFVGDISLVLDHHHICFDNYRLVNPPIGEVW